ncbi:MAG: efflux RND transporter periplasmic adaptor subunit [Proteobacteria bacterium]|nr:efflux RND transporter periplasmic adaptor subunit [Pseudomonadota bacterium]
MASSRNLLAPLSLLVAVVCAGWAIYVTKRAGDVPAGFGPPGAMSRPAAADGAKPVAGKPGPPAAGGRPAPLVATVLSRQESIAATIEALGTARANESVDVTAKNSNLVTAIHFRDGQVVKRGDLLVELDSAAVRADLAVAQAALTDSQSQFERSRELLAKQLVSKSQYEQLEAAMKGNEARLAAARARREDTVIRAPFSGRVGLRRVSVGSLVNPGTVITTLDDTSTIKLDFRIPENQLAGLRAGLTLTAQSPAFPSRSFEGKIATVDSRVDEATRSVTVRALLPNPDGVLKAGMFLTVQLEQDRRNAVIVPEEALVPETDKQYVFVVTDAVANKREVTIGRRTPGSVEIVAGLKAGERVVTEGTQSIRDGVAVRDAAQAVDSAEAART